MAVVLRDLRDDDRALLIRATLENMNWCGAGFTREQVIDDPSIAHYFVAWPNSGDFGFVALGPSRRPIGVVWLCHFDDADPGYGYVGDDIPELSIWVDSDHRGGGIGSALLAGIIARAEIADLAGISLSVEMGNPARRLYERFGFVPVGEGFDPGTLVLRI